MGLRGPQPKPGSKGSRVVKRTKPMDERLVGPVEAPTVPAGLLAPTKAWWAKFWSSELSRFLKPTDLTALEQLAILYDERERAQHAIRRTRVETYTDTDGTERQARVSNRLVMGSKGQPVLNPLIRYVEDLQGDITRLEDRFGLTPKARLALGLQLAEGTKRLEDLIVDEDDDEADDGQPRVIEIAEQKAGSKAPSRASRDLASPPG